MGKKIVESSEKKGIPDDEYKVILLKIMDSIDTFCRENNIQYYVLGGTLLGAVRHKGFIPWDDDIDIGMLRKDYDRFCREFHDKNHENYCVISVENNEGYYLPAAKVIDQQTRLRENLNQAIDIGAYIDVFPLDYVCPNKVGKFDYFEKDRIKTALHNLKKMSVSKNRSIWKNTLVLIGHILCRKSVHSIALDEDKRARELSSDEKTEWIANYHGAWKVREIMSSALFDETADYEFCGRKFQGVKQYDAYLTNLYGDYMKLPPIEKRVTHHAYTVEWK